jgi:uncharacterized membrane protein YdbT with pleckstrin-like domain
MLCSACSTEVPAGSTFCPKCGQRLSASSPSSASAAAAHATQSGVDRLRAAQQSASRNNDPEEQLWHGSYSPKAMFGSWILAGIVTLAAIVLCVLVPNPIAWIAAAIIVPVLWLAMAGYLLYERMSVDYTLTTQRFVHKHGIFRRVTDRTEVIDIDDVRYEQGFIERMFGVGTIKLLSSDTSDPELTLRGIDDVQRVATLIDDARRDERRKRGMYIESV